VFAVAEFRVVFAARTLAVAADSLRIFAFSVLMFAVTGSPLVTALAFGAGFLPQVLGGVLLGVLPDRLGARTLITAGYSLEAVLAVVLAVTGPPVPVCLALVGGVACLTPVFNGASGRVLAEILDGDAYVLGRSLSGMSAALAQLVGLAAGGVAVGAVGPGRALLVSAGCYLVAALIVRTGLARHRRPAAGAVNPVAASWAGARTLLTDRVVRRLLLAQWLPFAFAAGAEALLVPYGADRRFGPHEVALLLAALPAGMLVGDLVVGRFVRPAARERWSAPLVVLLGAPLSAVALSPPLPILLGLLALSGAGFAYTLGLQRAFVDAVPESHRGQAFTILSTGLMTVQGVGPLAMGAAAQLVSATFAIAVSGLLTILTAPSARLSPRRRLLRQTPDNGTTTRQAP
jgi:predicted MFS family arabinose efflux permease